MYNCYLRYKVRKLPQMKNVSFDVAKSFQERTGDVGVVVDIASNEEVNLLEEENAEDFRSEDRLGSHNTSSGGGSIPETPGGELFTITIDNTE